MHARALGWRSVAAPAVFVQHHGSISFAEEKDARVRENLAVLNQLYPDYPTAVQRFIQNDPLAASRARVCLKLLEQRAPGYVLHIGHSWGGGTERALRDIAHSLSADGVSSLIMEPTTDGAIVFSSMDGKIPVYISLKDSLAPLVKALKSIGVFHIHVHQMIGYPAALWELPRLLGVPYDVSIHDYLFICPRVQLINNNGIFCGQPEEEVCEACCNAKPLETEIEAAFTELGGTAADWRKFHAEQLRSARMVITPSSDAGRRIQRYQTFENIRTLPHPEGGKLGILRPQGGRISVAVIGAIGPHKGSDLLFRCAKYAKDNEIPITFVIVGFTNMDYKFRELDNVLITGKYKPADLPKLIDVCGCSIALFLSGWPETYSYTLSEALENGLMPVAFDLGAFHERIEAAGRGLCIPFSSSAETVVSALIHIGEVPGNTSGGDGQPVGRNYRSIAEDYYGIRPPQGKKSDAAAGIAQKK